ncbi:MAG: hypothetical protein ACI3VB_05950 [Oscillospiraceae bacterium]
MTTNSFIPMEMKTCVIKVESYEHKILQGTLYNPHFSAEVQFKSSTELFMLMDGLFDDLKFPQRTMKQRTFTEEAASPQPSAQEEIQAKPPLATFKLNVQFRQNASWQGTLYWLDKKTEASFRSVLELTYLMDSAITDAGGESR